MPTRTPIKKKRPVAKKTKKLAKAVKKTMKRTAKKATRGAKKKIIVKATKKAARKILKKPVVLGKVIHYYGHIGVAIVDVAMPIRLGDTVRVKHGTQEYAMVITSMQIDHQPVASAKKKDVIGMKTTKKVPQGAVLMPA